MIGFDPSEVNARASRAPDSNIGRFCKDIRFHIFKYNLEIQYHYKTTAMPNPIAVYIK